MPDLLVTFIDLSNPWRQDHNQPVSCSLAHRSSRPWRQWRRKIPIAASGGTVPFLKTNARRRNTAEVIAPLLHLTRLARPHASSAVSAFGLATKAKLSNAGAAGAPEDQLRAPIEALFRDLAVLAGLPEGAVALVGESTLSHLKTRPDYAVTVHNALVGFIEVKAPARREPGPLHRRARQAPMGQAQELAEPHLHRWRELRPVSATVLRKARSRFKAASRRPETSSRRLRRSLPLISDFLGAGARSRRATPSSSPIRRRGSAVSLARRGDGGARPRQPGLTSLATEGRALLFPAASDGEFADGYAQPSPSACWSRVRGASNSRTASARRRWSCAAPIR